MVQLVAPSESYRDSYQEALQEFKDEGRDLEYRALQALVHIKLLKPMVEFWKMPLKWVKEIHES